MMCGMGVHWSVAYRIITQLYFTGYSAGGRQENIVAYDVVHD